jgi:alpha-beta hydrolase superfamily lysophospholipase
MDSATDSATDSANNIATEMATDAAQPKRAIVLFHRGHEHGARMAHLVDELDLPDYDFFAWDARGLGRSPGERGYAPSFASLIKDVDCFIRHIERQHGIAARDLAIIAQSVAAVVVASWVHDFAPEIRAMVLASPAFKVKLYVPLARPSLALMQQFRPKFFVNSYVKAKFLTHDPVRVASYDADPLITRPIAVNVLLGLYEAAERVIEDAQAINVPTQLLISGADWIVHHAPQHRFFERLGSRDKETHLLPGFYHDTLGELERPLAIGKARAFLLRQFAQPASVPDLRQSHQSGPSYDEFTRLSRPASGLAALYWGMTRFWIRFGAHFAKGLETGVRTGFDSGSMLDYVYRNQSSGVPLLGTLVDRIFLNSIGWRGIRVRKLHLEQLIGNAMARLTENGQPVRLVDIAAGHGRYILEALARRRAAGGTGGAGGAGGADIQILLRDYSELNVSGGRKLIAELGLSDCARFELGDAFNHADLAQLTPRPTLAVVSGLYELFADNALINASLTGLAKAQDAGSYLIYTNQPWHPQLELIARGLSSHRQGQPWVMRRRSQAEMDQLVAGAGYRKLDQLSDEWGIFSVSLAQKI